MKRRHLFFRLSICFVVYIMSFGLGGAKVLADELNVEHAANCVLVPNNLDIVKRGHYFYLGEVGGSLMPQVYRSEQSADAALRIFEFNGFRKYCTVNDSAGRAVFEYFVTSESVAPGYYSAALETCDGFLESGVTSVFDARTKKYQIRSAGQVIVDGLNSEATGMAVASTMVNLRMNASCTLPNSTLSYWKSLYQPLPPTDRDPNRPAFFIEDLKWNLDNRGFERRYRVTREDISREMPFAVSFSAENKSSDAVQVSSTIKINNTILNQQNFSVPANNKKIVSMEKRIVISQVATSLEQQVSVELKVERNRKPYSFSKRDTFDLGL